jgi:hypothetical protein
MSRNKNKQRLNRQRQEFLLTFFDKDEYQEKEVNGFWLVKHWNGNSKRWQVAIYPEGHLKRSQKKLL